ncbi:MAG: class I SAM-dependent methyltransferase [Clostridia bacterium]|nr:class I SAM-dependent methyltransferase [Clostridia bacterium]
MSQKAYAILGRAYDSLISDYPYQKMEEKLSGFLSGKGFDVGAGSGMLTVCLAKSGLSVVAVEPSEEMLAVAKEKAKREKVNPVFVKSKAEDVEFTPCNFVIATCDVLNYLPSKKAFEIFVKKVHRSLKSEGKFVFDIRRMDILKSMNGQVYYDDQENITYLWTNSVKGDKLNMSLTFFEKDESGKYERADEEHKFLMLSDEYVIEILDSAGFSVKAYGDGLGKRKSSDNRIFFFCTKK